MISPLFRPQPKADIGPLPTGQLKHRGDDGDLPSVALRSGVAILLAYFFARLLFFALNISSFVPPDEVTHAGLCKLFSRTWLIPGNTPDSYEFGLTTNIPWLYYWTMGKLLHLNFLGIPDLVFLRLINIPLAFGTIFFVRRTLRLVTGSRLAQLLLVAVLTNTAMFSLLSATVSYDNLANLLAAMAVYYLLAFFPSRSPHLLAAALVAQLAGCLAKMTFLPLVLVLDLLLLVHERRNLRQLSAALAGYFRSGGNRARLLGLLVLIGFVLNLQLYGMNYYRYRALVPSMSQVLSVPVAMNYRLDARGIIFNQYKAGKISYMDALILAGEIKHPGDKADTFYLLMNYENLKRNPGLWLSPLAYAGVWFETMTSTAIGIKAHLSMLKDARYLAPVYVLMALSFLGFLRRFRPRDSGWLPACLAAIACFYAGFLLWKVNYATYLNYGAPALTLFGRYLFPVIGPLTVLFCHYLLQLFGQPRLRLALALATALLFVAYDFPWFLSHATGEWYEWLPR